MTPEQKELVVQSLEAHLAWEKADEKPAIDCNNKENLNDPRFEKGWSPKAHSTWCHEHFFYRLAPPAGIPWHNPEGVTQEQLESEKGWRFLVKEELDGRYADNPGVQIWNRRENKFKWAVRQLLVEDSSVTYRVNFPLPSKYQHLVPESEEARARRLLADLKAPEGYSEPEFLGSGPVGIEDEFIYAVLVKSSCNPAWQWQHFLNGSAPSCFYARARELPTDQEKAEAALNACKLEPGERLVHRGKNWWSDGPCNFLKCVFGNVTRKDNGHACGIAGNYYAEIIKEPELVPFTRDTWPVGAILRSAQGFIYQPITINNRGVWRMDVSSSRPVCEEWDLLLEHEWKITTDSGTTWTRAGKGVGA